MKVIYLLLILLVVSLCVLVGFRLFDRWSDNREWFRLAALQPEDPVEFDPSMVADLPEPAKRFFNFAIIPGTPLFPVAEIDMKGSFSLGSKEEPDYRNMEAHQILAAPHGFVWRVCLPGLIPISGSDTGSWTRFRILWIIPVARMGGDPDHARSAFGRYVAEAVFWTPAALLPGPGINWEGLDGDTASVTVKRGDLSQSVDVKVDASGKPVEVYFMRWSNANPDNEYRLQPFGGYLSDFRNVLGYRLPFRIDAGNMFGTNDYFPFFRAEVTAIRFPGKEQRK